MSEENNGVSKEWFEQNCPKLFNAIRNRKPETFELYGMKLKLYGGYLEFMCIKDRIENCKYMIGYELKPFKYIQWFNLN